MGVSTLLGKHGGSYAEHPYHRSMEKIKLVVLTGASRGLGLAMAEALIDSGHQMLCVSRGQSSSLQQRAAARGTTLEQWSMDLAQGGAVATRLKSWMAAQDGRRLAVASLINNAAALARIGPLSQACGEDLTQALRVGLEAPMLLTAAFLLGSEAWTGSDSISRRVLNISSGLGRRAMASQAGYCAVKAGIDHFTRCLALDEARKPHGARVCSLAPGVIDTDMQLQLRAAAGVEFPDRANFVGLKEKGLLTSPADAARQVLAYLARSDFGSQPIGDVRD